MNTVEPPTNTQFFTEFLLWFVPSLLIITMIMSIHYFLSVKNDHQYSLHNERVIVELIDEMLGESLATMSSDAKSLSYLAGTLGNPTNPESALNLTDYFAQLSLNNANYDQVRFINHAGYETIRVNNIKGQINAVAPHKLQNKSHRYYFHHSFNLEQGSVYISPMDLNVEDGKIEHPLNPTIRLGAPVFDANNKKIGVIILNYKARKLINKLLTIAPNFINHLYLLNPEGVAVIHPTNNDEFSFLTDRSVSPDVLSQIKKRGTGQLNSEGNYYTFSHMNTPNNGQWTIISVFPEQRLNLARIAFSNQFLWVYFSLFALFLLASLGFSRYRVQARYLQQQQRFEKQFRHTLENIQLAAVSLNAQGKIIFCNDFFLNLVGYKRHEVIDQDWVETFIPKELKTQASEALTEALKHSENQPHAESVIQRKSKEISLVSWTSTFSRSHSDNARVVTFIGEDITEQQMHKDQLQTLSHAVEQSQNSVMITDVKGSIIYVNPVFCELTGYSQSEIIGRTPKFLQSGEMSPEDYKKLWACISEGQEWRGEFHNRKKNGELFWERARISPVKDIEGQPLYFVAVKQDITEEKRLAEEVEHQTMKRNQHEKLAAVGKVVNMIAHDLRNPLSSVKMALQIYARKEQDELFDISLEQVRYMEAILEDLMAYSRPEQFKPEWLDLNKLVELTTLSQQRLAKEKNVSLELSLQANLPTVYADTTKLRQALQNLIINGIQAAESTTETTPQVVVSTNILITETDTRLLIDIKNNGQSIEPCLTDKVFEPFFTTKAKGTGLGLAIVKRIVESHAGEITLNPISPIGTKAQIQLPIAPPKRHE